MNSTDSIKYNALNPVAENGVSKKLTDKQALQVYDAHKELNSKFSNKTKEINECYRQLNLLKN